MTNRLDPELAEHYDLPADVLTPVPEGPVSVLNLFRLREVADDGAGVRPRTGLEALLAYSAVSSERLAAVGGRFLTQGLAAASLWHDESWDVVVVASYPDVSAFVALLEDPAYRAAYADRRAAVAEQRVVVASSW